MKIRDATEGDLPAIVDIYNRSIGDGKASTNVQPSTVLRSTGWFRQHKATGKPLIVAEDAGRVVGWLSIRPFYRRPAYRGTGKLLVYVDPGSRGKGIGKDLVDKAVSAGRSCGLNKLVCYVLAENDIAKRLFEDSGFESWGLFPGVASLGGREKDLLVLGRSL